MQMIDFETSIQHFLDLGHKLQSIPLVTAEDALEALVIWYRSFRIQGAEIDHDGDMLLLQWGTTRPFRFTEPTDLRQFQQYDRSFWDSTNYVFIDLTRQVFVQAGKEDSEFDDAAVQMSITLCYEPDAPEQQGSDIWIPTPNDIDPSLAKFRAVPLVGNWWSKPAVRIVVTVGRCG
jgi:hypothetical protein